jgi:hypothetical protein
MLGLTSAVVFIVAVLLPAVLIARAITKPMQRRPLIVIVGLIGVAGIILPDFLGQVFSAFDYSPLLSGLKSQLSKTAYQNIFCLLILAGYIGFEYSGIGSASSPPASPPAPPPGFVSYKAVRAATAVMVTLFFIVPSEIAFFVSIVLVVFFNCAFIYLARKPGCRKLFILPILLNALWLFGPEMFSEVRGTQANARFVNIVTSLRDDLNTWYWIPVVLSFITFVCFVISPAGAPENSKGTFEELFGQQKAVWLAFGGTITLVALWLISFFVQTNVAVSGSEALLEVIQQNSLQLAVDASRLNSSIASWQSSLVLNPSNPVGSNFAPKDEVSTGLALIEQHAKDLSDYIANVNLLAFPISHTGQLSFSLHSEQQAHALQQISITLPAIRDTVTKVQSVYSPTRQITYTSEEIAQVIAWGGSLNSVAGNLQKAGHLLTADRSIAQLITTALLLVFLLYPWLLYIAFIASKRSSATRNNRRTLDELGLLDRALNLSTDDKNIVAAQDVRRLVREWQSNKSFTEYPLLVSEIKKSLEDVDDLRLVQLRNSPMRDHREAKHIAEEVVLERRSFYSREYVLPLVMMTLLTAVGWFYIFFPNAQAGLVDLMVFGPTAKNVAAYLTYSLTPITLAFAGGWILTTVTLAMRWFQDDLYPRSYLYAALRLTFSFLVGIIFVKFAGAQSPFFEVTAFVIGIFPLEFVLAIVQFVKKTALDLRASGVLNLSLPLPDWSVKQPLTELTELTFWDDTRLYTEGVLNMHGLANADLEKLILNTPFAPQQLLSWVDQALLRLHAGTYWHTWFAQANFTTASQVLRFCDDFDETGKSDDDTKKKQRVVVTNLVNKAPKERISSEALPSQIMQAVNDFGQAVAAYRAKIESFGSVSQDQTLKAKADMQAKLNAVLKALTDESGKLEARYIPLLEALQRMGRIYAVEDAVYDLRASQKLHKTLVTALAALPDQWKDLPDPIDDDSRKKLTAGLQPTLATANNWMDATTSMLQKVTQVVRPQFLDEDTLQVILDSLRKSPNVEHLMIYWKNRKSDLNK